MQESNVIRTYLSFFVFQQGAIGPPGDNGAPGAIGLLVSIFSLERLSPSKRIFQIFQSKVIEIRVSAVSLP